MKSLKQGIMPMNKNLFSLTQAYSSQGLKSMLKKEDNTDEDEDCDMEGEVGEENLMVNRVQDVQERLTMPKPLTMASPQSQRDLPYSARKNPSHRVPLLQLQGRVP